MKAPLLHPHILSVLPVPALVKLTAALPLLPMHLHASLGGGRSEPKEAFSFPGSACCLFAAVYTFYRFARVSSASTLELAGLAASAKFTGILLAPTLLLLLVAQKWWSDARSRYRTALALAQGTRPDLQEELLAHIQG